MMFQKVSLLFFLISFAFSSNRQVRLHKRIEDYLSKAREASQKGNYKIATMYYKKILEMEPNNQPAKDELSSLDRKSKAIEIFKKIEDDYKKGLLEQAKEKTEQLISLAVSTEAYTSMPASVINTFRGYLKDAITYFNGNQVSLAESSIVKAIEVYPLDKEAILLYGKIKEKMNLAEKLCSEGCDLFKKNQYLRASSKFLATLEIDNSHPKAKEYLTNVQKKLKELIIGKTAAPQKEVYYAEGFWYYNQGLYAEAMNSWKKALALTEKSEMLLEIGTHEIEEYLQKAKSKLESLEIEKLLGEGRELFAGGRYSDAQQKFVKVLELEPSNQQALEYVKRISEKIAEIQAIEEAKEKEKKLRFNLSMGKSYYEKGDLTRARKYFENVLELEPENQEAQDYLELIRKKVEMRKPREKTPKKVPKPTVDKEKAEKHYQQGLTYYASGLLEEAIKEWEITLRIDPEHKKAQIALDKARKELKKR